MHYRHHDPSVRGEGSAGGTGDRSVCGSGGSWNKRCNSHIPDGPDLAIVFEGSPSDDFYFSAAQTQGHMRGGVQIRRMDKSYISNPVFIEYAEELAEKFGIPFQETVRRGGSTNAGKISLTAKAVPVLVLGVPSRYVHTHYNFCAKSDLEAAADLAVEVIRGLDAEKIRHICRQDILK